MRIIRAMPAILIVLVACTSGGPAGSPPSPTPPSLAGGTLRVGILEPINLDPHVGFAFTGYQPGWALMRCCLLRTLVSYNGRSAAEGGARVLPDLAARTPEVSSDGLTWTFELKEGIRYAPPLEEVEVTSSDFVRALERSARPEDLRADLRDSVGPVFLSVIEGYEEFGAGSADTISGLETPDPHTLVVRLTEPAGDLPNRLALPAAAPLPPNPFDEDARLGVADGLDFSYDRFLVSTGPYMIEGSGDVDLSALADVRAPAAGLVPGRSLTLVRNPSWDPATDDLREAFVDRIEIVIGLWPGTGPEFALRVERGELDLIFDLRPSGPPGGLGRWRADPVLSERLAITSIPNQWFVGINLAQPPLDDLHVRRAVALAVNRAALARITSMHRGHAIPSVPGHIAPDPFLDLLLAEFDPFGTTAGDLAAARAEMRRSAYDEDGDGRCDQDVCRDLTAFTRSDLGGPKLARRIAADLASLGIGLRVEETGLDSAYGTCTDPRAHAGLCINIGWIADFPNGSQFFPGMFGSDELGRQCYWCGNLFLLGATAEQLASWGYDGAGIAGVDDRLARCVEATGREQFACWAELDQYLMTEVVPLIPIARENTARIFSERVVGFTVDEFMTMPSLDHIAVRDDDAGALEPVTSFGPTAPLPPGEPGVPDGNYETRITMEDAVSVGFRDDESCVEEDQLLLDSAGCLVGRYRLTVEDGRWAWEQEAPLPSCLWFSPDAAARGRIAGAGRQVTLVPTNTCRGAPVTLRASLAGGALSFRLVSTNGAMDPWYRVIFESHPWEKVA